MRLYPFLFICLVGGGMLSASAEQPPSHIIVPLLYASDRAAVTDGDDYDLGDERGELGFGRVAVALSTSRESNSPFADWHRWEAHNGFMSDLSSVRRIEPAADLDDLVQQAREAGAGRDVLLYVHGYLMSFKRASVRFARALYATGYDGVPVLFSWPATSNPLDYAGDVERQAASAANLAGVIGALLADPEVGRVHLVAHSLGNQTLVEALRLLRESGGLVRPFGEVVLFAPDYDQAEFTAEALPLLETLCARVSLYVSGKDIPLLFSRVVNNGKRVGDASGGAFTAAAIETIDVSPVARVLEGHTTLQNDAFVQADLHYLLVKGLAAAERPTLRRVESETGGYWEADPAFAAE